MARRSRRPLATAGSLDSFLDIVTNSLGLLILVALLSAFSTQGVKIRLGTPIMTEAPESQELVSFEIRGGRIAPIEDEPLLAEIREFVVLDGSAQITYAEEFNRRQRSDGYHRLELVPGYLGGLLDSGYKLHPTNHLGDPVEALRDRTSVVGNKLSKLDPRQHWLYFHVRSDSFEELREARLIAAELGFDVGWRPLTLDDEMEFTLGGGGRAPRKD